MKNKGFTLIELLAVIVILAIIALIATPIILGIINDARTQAKKRSAELVCTGVEYAYTSAMYGGTSGSSVADPDLNAVKTHLNIDNLDPENPPVIADVDNVTTLTIKTKDGVSCAVTGTAGANDTVVAPFHVDCDDGFIEKDIPALPSQDSEEEEQGGSDPEPGNG